MDENLQARIANLRASRRAGARNAPSEKSADWLEEWTVHKHVGEVDSTQAFAERFNAQTFDENSLTVVSADLLEQGNSGSDCQTEQSAQVSFAFRFPADCSDAFVCRNAPTVTQVLAVSTIDTLRAMLLDQEGMSLALKCPDGILINNKQIASVFNHGEMTFGSRADWVMVSVLVNVSLPDGETTTSLRSVFRDDLLCTAEVFGAKLATRFSTALWKLFVSGFAFFTDRINSLDAHTGEQIKFSVQAADGLIDGLEGTYLSVNDSGHVLVKLTNGDTHCYPRSGVFVRTTKLS